MLGLQPAQIIQGLRNVIQTPAVTSLLGYSDLQRTGQLVDECAVHTTHTQHIQHTPHTKDE